MAQLGPILDFMYSGQVNVVQDELNTFLATARVLKVNGLSTENNGIKETTGEPSEINSFVFTLYFTIYRASTGSLASLRSVLQLLLAAAAVPVPQQLQPLHQPILRVPVLRRDFKGIILLYCNKPLKNVVKGGARKRGFQV